MKINLAESYGFCFGVKRALKIALDAAKEGKQIEMLGDIVHNEDVVKTIKKAGIKRIQRLTRGKNRTLLIRAHGAAKSTVEKAKRLGYEILDATCPMVKEIHKITLTHQWRGYNILIIGDKKHDEVNGILGQIKGKALVIDSDRNVPFAKIKRLKKACIVVQSTQNIEAANKIVDILRKHIKEIKFFDTVCQPTKTKQKEIKAISLANDVIIIIGSKTSANTKRLYQISKAINKRSYWVQSHNELNPQWFKDAKTVGVTAGASTPDETTKKAIEQVRKIAHL